MTYSWTTADHDTLKRENDNGSTTWIVATPGNPAYDEYLASDQTAAEYVAPTASPEPTDEEKLEQATGLTVAEIKAVLGL